MYNTRILPVHSQTWWSLDTPCDTVRLIQDPRHCIPTEQSRFWHQFHAHICNNDIIIMWFILLKESCLSFRRQLDHGLAGRVRNISQQVSFDRHCAMSFLWQTLCYEFSLTDIVQWVYFDRHCAISFLWQTLCNEFPLTDIMQWVSFDRHCACDMFTLTDIVQRVSFDRPCAMSFLWQTLCNEFPLTDIVHATCLLWQTLCMRHVYFDRHCAMGFLWQTLCNEFPLTNILQWVSCEGCHTVMCSLGRALWNEFSLRLVSCEGRCVMGYLCGTLCIVVPSIEYNWVFYEWHYPLGFFWGSF